MTPTALGEMMPPAARGVVPFDRISWVVTSYLAAVSVMIPMSGWLAVRIGRRRYLLFSVMLFVAASALCGLAKGIGQMVVCRVIRGAAGAAMMPLSQAILLETFPVEEHTLAMTTFGIGMMAAPVIGPTLGGWITESWSWRWNFYINVPTGAFAAPIVTRMCTIRAICASNAAAAELITPGLS
jgi:DHA2 family multidrug resistance protein